MRNPVPNFFMEPHKDKCIWPSFRRLTIPFPMENTWTFYLCPICCDSSWNWPDIVANPGSTINFWTRLLFNTDPNAFILFMLADYHESNWLKLTPPPPQIRSLGISLGSLYLSFASAVFHTIKLRLFLQHLTEAARKTCSTSYLGFSQTPGQVAIYFLFLNWSLSKKGIYVGQI